MITASRREMSLLCGKMCQ